jgi:hypothetical protein
METITTIYGKTIGIIYITFGERAARGADRSMTSLRNLGISIPAVSVGDFPMSGYPFFKWIGKSPWVKGDPAGKFYAGEIKPYLYGLSPFDLTLYLDADTEFRQSPLSGFAELGESDFLLWQAREPNFRSVEIIREFDSRLGFSQQCVEDTLKEIPEPFNGIICSGIIFFKKKPAVAELFIDWYKEWLKYRAWDEQGPLIRALYQHKDDVKFKPLNGYWNSHSLSRKSIIYHYWGSGDVRSKNDPHPSKLIQEKS